MDFAEPSKMAAILMGVPPSANNSGTALPGWPLGSGVQSSAFKVERNEILPLRGSVFKVRC